jgi:DNA repair exonuclease SbcCD nuclease subunit
MKFRNKEDLLYNFDGVKVEVLGDPHLGKRFVSGVPLHRRGEREQMMWHDFQNSIILTEADVHVCMGDLFDNFVVDPTTMVTAAQFYQAAAMRNTNTHYFILMGNHDMSRDKDKFSSFRVFKEMVTFFDNIHVVLLPQQWEFKGQHFAFFPYDPFINSYDMMAECIKTWKGKKIDRFAAIFGHWDLDEFGEMPHNLFPHELATTITDQAFTGHIHLPDIREYGALELVVVGSMQPYNHSEDPDRLLYVSLTMDMLKAMDPTTLKDKCVRIVLAPNEDAPESLDCLQYTTKRMDAPDEDEDLTVELEDFDFLAIIRNELGLQGVTDPSVTSFIETEFQRLRAEEANA